MRRNDLNPFTKVMAACGAKPIPLRPDHVITIFAIEEYRLATAKLL